MSIRTRTYVLETEEKATISFDLPIGRMITKISLLTYNVDKERDSGIIGRVELLDNYKRELFFGLPFDYLQIKTFKARLENLGEGLLLRNMSPVVDHFMCGYAELDYPFLELDLLHAEPGRFQLSFKFLKPGSVTLIEEWQDTFYE